MPGKLKSTTTKFTWATLQSPEGGRLIEVSP
jgi:hypothetical protein